MLLASVVETSRRVADTTQATGKDRASRRACIRQLSPKKSKSSSSFSPARLARAASASVTPPCATLAIRPPPIRASKSSTSTAILQSITETSGSGSQRRRLELLQTMFARATEAEQQFLTGLLMGELRQGALEGIMLEAVAKASGISSRNASGAPR